VILNAKKNPNFSMMVKHVDIELPEQEMYCPPLTIRVVDCRSVNREKREGAGRYFCPLWLLRRWCMVGQFGWLSLTVRFADSRSRIYERTILLRFLGIILRVLRLEVSVWHGVWFSIRFSSSLLYSVN
jgi:hypothetical protein